MMPYFIIAAGIIIIPVMIVWGIFATKAKRDYWRNLEDILKHIQISHDSNMILHSKNHNNKS